MPKHLETGQIGEEAAARFLEQKGYQVLERNYRYKKAEIDLIVRKENLLVFVEVKTRTNLAFGMPETFVSARKAQLITKAADEYIFANNWHGNIRFDIVAVIIKDQQMELEHFEDAFY